MKQTLTAAIIRAAANDAGMRSMRKAGRSAWAAEDWNAACAELDRLTVHGGMLEQQAAEVQAAEVATIGELEIYRAGHHAIARALAAQLVEG